MSLGIDELRELNDTLTDLMGCADLMNWEIGFVEDMLTRLETYGDRTIISDRQYETIEKLKTKYLDGDGTAALPFDTD